MYSRKYLSICSIYYQNKYYSTPSLPFRMRGNLWQFFIFYLFFTVIELIIYKNYEIISIIVF